MFTDLQRKLEDEINSMETQETPRTRLDQFRSSVQKCLQKPLNRTTFERLARDEFGSDSVEVQMLGGMDDQASTTIAASSAPPAKRAKKLSPLEHYAKMNISLANWNTMQLFKEAIARGSTREETITDAALVALFYRLEHIHMPRLLNAVAMTLATTHRARVTQTIYETEIMKMYRPDLMWRIDQVRPVVLACYANAAENNDAEAEGQL